MTRKSLLLMTGLFVSVSASLALAINAAPMLNAVANHTLPYLAIAAAGIGAFSLLRGRALAR